VREQVEPRGARRGVRRLDRTGNHAALVFPRDLELVSAEADVRVGGQFRAVVSNGSQTFTVHGTYREVVPGQRLVFSHQWQEHDASSTLVTVEFSDRDGGTLVSLTHQGFRDRQSIEGYRSGWQSTFDNLVLYLSGATTAGKAALDGLPTTRLSELPIAYFDGRHDYDHAPTDTSLL